MSDARGPAADRVAQRAAAALAAAEHLGRVDARMGALIARIGPHRPILTADPFRALVGSILQQQISMLAAAALQRRLRDLCGGRVSPPAILRLSPRQLRAAGLSRQKVEYVRNLADAFASRRLTRGKLRAMDDEAVIAATTQIKGIGRWTAEMLLIFCLERPDVWPVDDLGLRKACRNFFGLTEMPAARALRDAGDRWRPYRSYATWYLWRSLEGPLMPGVAV